MSKPWPTSPLILGNGSAWYTELGTDQSKGTKIFSLAGKVNNTGLVEVPIGTTIKEVVYGIGGGIPKGRRFKAVQMGGPSGGCVPTQFLHTPIDYDTLQRLGAIMGSGGMVVMDENNCMVEIARFFLSFTQSESCGKCTPCRLGTTQLLEILTKITQGQGRMKDILTIRDIGRTVTEASLCGLGQNCAKPALSTLTYFLKEFENHILEHRCDGAVCESMVITACQHACPAGIDIPNYVAAVGRGDYRRAVEIIRERNPFPAVCGYICIHPCEYKCRRGELDEPVAIRSIKRTASDWFFEHVGPKREPFPVTRDQSVAIVGAGPADLTCAYFLAKMGYKTHVFEAKSVAGGMLGLAIPEFRLPREVIESEIEYIENCGVAIHYNSPIDANHNINDLLNEGFDAEGRFNPSCDDQDLWYRETDHLIVAIGQALDLSFLSDEERLERELWGGLAVDSNTLATNIKGVFAGGDFTTGPTFVIRAISSGRRAALAIDNYLSGREGKIEIPDEKSPLEVDARLALEDESLADKPRIPPTIETPTDRKKDFRIVELGLSPDEARQEAYRCLRCDLEKEAEYDQIDNEAEA